MSAQMTAMPLTPMVKKLIIANVGIWIIFQLILDGYAGFHFTRWGALYPSKVIYDLYLWQPVTYMFLHSLQINHILFNMLMLWMVGGALEQRWGQKAFLAFYMITGVGAALLYSGVVTIYTLFTGAQAAMVVPVVGASGALFGLLVAYGILFSETTMYFMMLFPMKAKHFVWLLGGIEFLSMLSSGVAGGEVAYLAHLGGILTGYLTLLAWTRMKQSDWRKAQKKKSRLRLVVDNADDKDDKKNPKYWN